MDGLSRDVRAVGEARDATTAATSPGEPKRCRGISLRKEIPLQRLGSPGDVAAVVAFLASPAAGYITGETIHVNGGMYMA